MSNLSDAEFSRLHKKLMDPNDGGFSVNAATGKGPKVGYMVSLPGFETQIRSENVAPAHIKEFMEKHADLLTQPDHFVGGWNNTKTGEVSLDVSQRIRGDRRIARRYGRQVAEADAYTTASDLAMARNQEAGWDIKRGKEIPNPHYYDDGRRSKDDPKAA